MTAPAIFMMIVTILLVWGGLVASVVMLRILPVPEETPDGKREEPTTAIGAEHLRHGSIPDNI